MYNTSFVLHYDWDQATPPISPWESLAYLGTDRVAWQCSSALG
jgi:hypothetical protein